MGEVVQIPSMETSIEIKRTPAFLEKAMAFSLLITNLPLTTEQNDMLVYAMVEQVKQVEHDAFLQGFELGIRGQNE